MMLRTYAEPTPIQILRRKYIIKTQRKRLKPLPARSREGVALCSQFLHQLHTNMDAIHERSALILDAESGNNAE